MARFIEDFRYCGFVGMVDLLGFQSMIDRISIQGIVELYGKILEEMRRLQKLVALKTDNYGFWWYADTFVLYSKSDDKENLKCLEDAYRFFFLHFIFHGIPIRGAISHGEFYIDESEGIAVGKSFVEAHQYADNLEMMTYSVCPSALIKAEQLDSHVFQSFHYRPATPQILKKHSDGLLCFSLNYLNSLGMMKNQIIAMRDTRTESR